MIGWISDAMRSQGRGAGAGVQRACVSACMLAIQRSPTRVARDPGGESGFIVAFLPSMQCQHWLFPTLPRMILAPAAPLRFPGPMLNGSYGLMAFCDPLIADFGAFCAAPESGVCILLKAASRELLSSNTCVWQ